MRVQDLPLVPTTRPCLVGGRRPAKPPRARSIRAVGSIRWSSSEGKSGTLKPCAPAARNRPPAPFPSSSAARAAGLHPDDRRFESIPREPTHPCGRTGRQPVVTRNHRGSNPREGAIHQGMAEPGQRRAAWTRESGGSNPPPLTKLRCSSTAERTSPKRGDEGSSPSAGAKFMTRWS